MGDRSAHCIPFGWHRRLYLPGILGVQFSETFIRFDLEEFARTGDRRRLSSAFCSAIGRRRSLDCGDARRSGLLWWSNAAAPGEVITDFHDYP